MPEDAVTMEEFKRHLQEAKTEKIENSMAAGPSYPNKPLRWGQQIFAQNLTPTKSVECAEAVYVGKTSGALDIVLIGSHGNSGAVSFAYESSVTVTTLGSDTKDGEYKAEGPSICLTAPSGGISVNPDDLACRIAIGDHSNWLKVNLDFAGTITGGKLDCCLGYLPR